MRKIQILLQYSVDEYIYIITMRISDETLHLMKHHVRNEAVTFYTGIPTCRISIFDAPSTQNGLQFLDNSGSDLHLFIYIHQQSQKIQSSS